MTTIFPKAKTQHLIVTEIDDETICGMVMYPNKATKLGRTQSPEPGIAEKHFGFEFWLTVSLFLFLAAVIIAQWLSSALVKPLETAARSTRPPTIARTRGSKPHWRAQRKSPATCASGAQREGLLVRPVCRPARQGMFGHLDRVSRATPSA